MPKELKLSKGYVTIVDDDAPAGIVGAKWCALENGWGKVYAMRTASAGGKTQTLLLHRVVAGASAGQYVDHINGDSLDNRRENLRVCTNSQNAMNRGKQVNNRSGFKGVSWNKKAGCWQAWIQVRGKRMWLGDFADKRDAAAAYDRAAREMHQDFACVNGVPNADA